MAVEIISSDIFTPEQLTMHSKIFAGPGAGKTHFLVENVKNIVTTHPFVAKSRTRKVLCITYTNAAVDEIVRRLDRYADSVEIHTIHGFIIEHIIKPFQQDLREIISEEFGITLDGKGQITSQVEGLGILHGIDKADIFKYITDKTAEITELSYSKKIMGDVQVKITDYLQDATLFASKKADEKLSASPKIIDTHILPIKAYIWSVVKKLTHDEILYFGYRILERNHTALYATRVKFPFIFVDEFQDTNPLQTMLIKLIGTKSTVIGIIGDIAQSIYSFQGAKPSQFADFAMSGERELAQYVINDNRRSTTNIVNFCNYLRQSDPNVSQCSRKPYSDDAAKLKAEAKKVHFIIGESDAAKAQIANILADGGVVLTRTWAAAFSYIRGITSEQVACLKKIYNSYYASPIDIRRDIEEHNFVTWVKAFKCIFGLWNGYRTGAFIDVLKAFSIYVDINHKKITPKFISLIKKLSENLFASLNENTTDKITAHVIENFNEQIKDEQYAKLIDVLGAGFKIPIFDDADKDDLKANVLSLNWQTSYKLFTEVFSAGSKYMTVHQAKGLEWEKVVVSLTPNKASNKDNITLEVMYSKPCLLEEQSAQEFTRMYYVACSRAKEDLYIHLPNGFPSNIIDNAIGAFIEKSGQQIEFEFI